MLINYSADEPECNTVTCTKGGNTDNPCAQCHVPHSKLRDVTRSYGTRTEQYQQVGLSFFFSERAR